MAKSIEEIRKELMAANAAAQGGTQGKKSFGPSASFPFWNAPAGTTTVLRFLPDSDPDRVFFWRERQVIRIPFATVEGHPELTNVEVEVPCVKMYNKKNVCPITQDTRSMWGTDQEDIARIYWPKKSFLYQGFVVSSDLDEGEVPENPIRRFLINKTIHKVIESAMTDPEMDANPTDSEFGYDFRIVKTKQGNAYADYSTSSFARRNRALSTEERQALETHGLFNLAEFLPREPDSTMMDTIVAMYEESRKPNSQYKLEWAEFYTPKGVQLSGAPSKATQAPATSSSQSVEDEDDAPFDGGTTTSVVQPQVSTTSASADIVSQLRARMQNGNS